MSREVQPITLVGEIGLASRRELDEAVDAFRASSAVHVELDRCDITFFGRGGLRSSNAYAVKRGCVTAA